MMQRKKMKKIKSLSRKVYILNRKIKMENEVTENETKNGIKVQTKYWHEC